MRFIACSNVESPLPSTIGGNSPDASGAVTQMIEVRHQIEGAEVFRVGRIHEPGEPFLDTHILSPERYMTPLGEFSEQQAFRLEMGIHETRGHQFVRRINRLRARVE